PAPLSCRIRHVRLRERSRAHRFAARGGVQAWTSRRATVASRARDCIPCAREARASSRIGAPSSLRAAASNAELHTRTNGVPGARVSQRDVSRRALSHTLVLRAVGATLRDARMQLVEMPALRVLWNHRCRLGIPVPDSQASLKAEWRTTGPVV